MMTMTMTHGRRDSDCRLKPAVRPARRRHAGRSAKTRYDRAMQWREVRWILDPAVADEASERLMAAGETSFVVAARSDGQVDFTAYGADTDPVIALAVLAELGAQPVGQTDLDEATLYAALNPDAPVELTPGVWVLPRVDADVPAAALALHLPPGPAWGDGRHPTTRMAASRLTPERCADQRVLDLGCGSGLLGVLAAKRGARSIDLADLDQHGLRVAAACCEANAVTARIFAGDLLDALPADASYDIVVANLWADLVLALLADVRLEQVLPHGCLILAGVNVQRRDEVMAALHTGGFTCAWQAEEAWWWSAEVHR